MNFTIPAADLRRMVDRLKLTRGREWFGAFEIDPDPARWHLVATSQGETVGSTAWAEMSGDQLAGNGDRFCVPLSRLDAWLSGVDGDVEIFTEGGLVHFATDDASLPLPTVPEVDPHPLPTVSPRGWVTYKGNPVLPPLPDEALPLPLDIWQALSRVSWATEPVGGGAPDFKNVLHVTPGLIWASDGKKLAAVKADTASAVSFYPELVDVTKTMDLEATRVTVDGDRRLHLTDGMGRFVLPTWAGSVPNIAPLIVDAEGRLTDRVTFSRKEMIDALARLKTLMAPDSTRVILSFEFGVVVLEVETADDHPSTREVACKGAEGRTIAFNLANLRSALAALIEDDATLELGTDSSGAMFHEGDYTALLMPIRGAAPARAKHRKVLKPRF